MAAPKWAQEYLLKAACWAETQGYKVPPFELKWRRCNKYSCSGVACNDTNPRWFKGFWININASKKSDKKTEDAKIIMLHELAHILNPNQNHTPKFWDTAWALYRWAGLPVKRTLACETAYRRGAALAYRRAKETAKTNKEAK